MIDEPISVKTLVLKTSCGGLKKKSIIFNLKEKKKREFAII